jgi:AcrR family transcriptional regulator
MVTYEVTVVNIEDPCENPAMATRRKKQGYHHGDLRNALIAAAVRLIEKRKDTAFTVREIAAEAGVSHAAAYRHFAAKRDILAAVAEAGFTALQGEFESLGKKTKGDIRVELMEQGQAYVRFAVQHPGYFRAMFHADLDDHSAYPSLAAISAATFGSLVSAVTRGVAAGTFIAREPMDLAVMSWSTVHGLASLIVDQRMQNPAGPTPSSEALALTIVELLMTGFLPR